jgi:Zn-dependent peptidase ImmA (M78 family)
MNTIYTNAIRRASELRLQLGLGLFHPINIYDVCTKLEVDVKFVDIDMEGLYVSLSSTPTILLSSLRPFPRKVFTCGHELGHHVFNHGFKVDILSDENDDTTNYKSSDEKLVDAFAAALLMPTAGIQAEFSKRKLHMDSANVIDFFTISSLFGVGYETLILHCKMNNLISKSKSDELLKLSPAKIFKKEFGDVGEKSFFKIIDGKSAAMPIDLEVSNYISLPSDFLVDKVFLEKKQEGKLGTLYLAMKSGISNVYSNISESAYFIRIQPQDYVGLAEYRHLEN